MLIQMIRGGYGLREGKFVTLKTKADEPFEVDEETAKRLCDTLEVAVRVGDKKTSKTQIEDNTALIQRYKALGGKGCPNSWKADTLKAKIAELEALKTAKNDNDSANSEDEDVNDNDNEKADETSEGDEESDEDDVVDGEIETDENAPDFSNESGIA